MCLQFTEKRKKGLGYDAEGVRDFLSRGIQGVQYAKNSSHHQHQTQHADECIIIIIIITWAPLRKSERK